MMHKYENFVKAIRWTGTTEKNNKAFEFIENVTRNADQVQKQVLAEVLGQGQKVSYKEPWDAYDESIYSWFRQR